MAINILGTTAALLLLAVSIYILLLKQNIRVAGFAVGASILTPLLIVTGNCMLNSQSEACAWGKARLPVYLIISAITIAPLLYLMVTAALNFKQKRDRKSTHRYRLYGGDAVRFNNKRLTHIKADGKSQSIRWQQVDEIRVIRATAQSSGKNVDWILTNRNQTRQLRIRNQARGMKQLVAHIQRWPGFDQESVKMAMATTTEINFLVWARRK